MKIELERAQQEIRKLDVELATSRAVSYEAIARIVTGDIFASTPSCGRFQEKEKAEKIFRDIRETLIKISTEEIAAHNQLLQKIQDVLLFFHIYMTSIFTDFC